MAHVIFQKDGLTFEKREVAIDRGKTPIGSVDVFAPFTLKDVAEGIEKSILTEAKACKLIKNALAVELQAAFRRTKQVGKMPEADFARLFKLVNDKSTKDWLLIKQEVNVLYRKERDEYREVVNIAQ